MENYEHHPVKNVKSHNSRSRRRLQSRIESNKLNLSPRRQSQLAEGPAAPVQWFTQKSHRAPTYKNRPTKPMSSFLEGDFQTVSFSTGKGLNGEALDDSFVPNPNEFSLGDMIYEEENEAKSSTQQNEESRSVIDSVDLSPSRVLAHHINEDESPFQELSGLTSIANHRMSSAIRRIEEKYRLPAKRKQSNRFSTLGAQFGSVFRKSKQPEYSSNGNNNFQKNESSFTVEAYPSSNMRSSENLPILDPPLQSRMSGNIKSRKERSTSRIERVKGGENSMRRNRGFKGRNPDSFRHTLTSNFSNRESSLYQKSFNDKSRKTREPKETKRDTFQKGPGTVKVRAKKRRTEMFMRASREVFYRR